jgi:hypothetical protein
VFISASTFAQYNETIRTGRPGEAIGPFAVGARVFQVQAGVGYLDYMKYKDLENSDLATVYGNYIPIAGVFRMGLTEHFEVNLGMAYTFEERDVNGSIKNKGLNAFAFGFRSNIYVGKGWIPSVGVQVNIGMPWLNDYYNSSYIRPRITLITGQRMGERWGLTTNWGLFWNGDSPDPRGFYVVNVSYDASSKWSVFVEGFGFIYDNTWEPHIDGGAGFLVNNNLQLDIAAGYGWGELNYKDWFVNGGVSWRMRFKTKEERKI